MSHSPPPAIECKSENSKASYNNTSPPFQMSILQLKEKLSTTVVLILEVLCHNCSGESGLKSPHFQFKKEYRKHSNVRG